MTKVIARLRPISPHLFWKTPHYKIQITSALSVFHRGTGAALAIFIPLFIVLPIIFESISNVNSTSSIALQYYVFKLIPLVVFGLLFCIYYHFFNGVRHVYWDTGRNLSNKAVRNSGIRVLIFTFVSTCTAYYSFFIENNMRIDPEKVVFFTVLDREYSCSYGTEELILLTTLIGLSFVFYGLKSFIEIFFLGLKKIFNFLQDLPQGGSFFTKAEKYYISRDGFYHWYLQRVGILFGGIFLFAFIFYSALLYHLALEPNCFSSFYYYGMDFDETLDDTPLYFATETNREFLQYKGQNFESLSSMAFFYASFLSTLCYLPLLLVGGPFIIWHASIGFQAIVKDYVHDVISKNIIITLIQIAAFAIILVYYSIFFDLYMSVHVVDPFILPTEFNLQSAVISFIKYFRDIFAQIFIIDTSVSGEDYWSSILYLEGPPHKPLRKALLHAGSWNDLCQNLSYYYMAMKSWQHCFMFDVIYTYCVYYDANNLDGCPDIVDLKVKLYYYTTWLHLGWGILLLVFLRPMGLLFFSMYKLLLHFFVHIPGLIFLPLISEDLSDSVGSAVEFTADFIDHLTMLSLGLYSGTFVTSGAFNTWLYTDFFRYCITDLHMTYYRAFEYVSFLETLDALFTAGVLVGLCLLPHYFCLYFFPEWYTRRKMYLVNGFSVAPTLLIFMNIAEVFSMVVFQTYLVPGIGFFYE